MSERSYRVGVFPHEGRRKRRYMAYLRDYNPQWSRCCEHDVTATSGTEAKRKAIEAHKAALFTGLPNRCRAVEWAAAGSGQ